MTSLPYFVVGPTGTVFGDGDAAAAAFAAQRAVICHDALDPAIVAKLDRICDAADFQSDHVEELGHRRIEKPALAGGTISLLLRRAPLFRWIEAVSGCGTIGDIEGRIVQTYADPGDELTWHDDLGGDTHRLLAVTVALTSPPYRGGTFELRRVGERNNLFSYKHDRPGSVLIFEISPEYEHRVLPLSSGGPRRVFTGWFMRA